MMTLPIHPRRRLLAQFAGNRRLYTARVMKDHRLTTSGKRRLLLSVHTYPEDEYMTDHVWVPITPPLRAIKAGTTISFSAIAVPYRTYCKKTDQRMQAYTLNRIRKINEVP